MTGRREGGKRRCGMPRKARLESIGISSYVFPIDMETVTLSPKFQVVIPRSIREELHLTPGEKLRVIRYGDRVEFIPVRTPREMRGLLRGIDTTIERDGDRL
jgi:AbrB family looped-hinge helix DNA binding protein